MTLVNDLAAVWWSWMWPVAWQVSILAALVLVLDVALRKWVWPQVLYALWLLVFVKLLLPASLTSPFSVVGSLLSVAAAPAAEPALSIGSISLPAFAARIDAPVEQYMSAQRLTAVEPIVGLSWTAWAMLAWLGGVLLVVAWGVYRVHYLRRSCAPAGRPELEARIVTALHEAATTLGIRRPPRVVITDSVTGPGVLGVMRPVLLIGREDIEYLAPVDLRNVLMHELAHIRRGDLVVHALSIVLLTVHWINPLLWLALSRARRHREACCDSTVGRALSDQTLSYRRTLLKTAQRLLDRPQEFSLGFLGLVEDSAMIVTRLKWLERAPWKRQGTIGAVVTGILLVVGIVVVPMTRSTASPESSETHGAADGTALARPGRPIAPTPPAIPEGEPRDWSEADTERYIFEFGAYLDSFAVYPAAYSGYVARTATYQESVGGRLLVEMRARPPSADGSVERPPSTEPAAIDRAGHVLYELARRGPHGDLPHDEPLPDDAPLDSRPEIVSGGSDPTSASSGPIVRVDVRLLVGTDGAVDSAMALVGDSSLHAEAHAAAMKIRYAPMTMEGRPVRVSLTRFVGVDTSSTGGRSETDGPRAIPTADQGADSADDTVYDFDDLDQPIRPVRMVAPRYSDSDTVLTTDDWVWLDVVVGPDGRVETARVVQGFPVLHEGAIAAALKTVYSSPTVGGRPVRVRDRLGLMSPALPPEATAPEKMFHPAYFSWLEGGGYEWTANRRLPHEPVFDVVGAAIDRVILAEPRRADVLEMMRNVPRPRWLAVHVRWLYGDDGLPLRVEAEVGRGALEEVDGRKWTDRHRRMRTDVGTPSVVAATRFAVRGALAELSNSLDVPLSGSARLMVGYRPETFR